MESIGIRELRQNASVYVRQVKAGATIEVTERGHPVALLTPLPDDPWEAMIASGQVRRRLRQRVGVPEPEDFGIDASATLTRLREDER